MNIDVMYKYVPKNNKYYMVQEENVKTFMYFKV